jgi:SOS response regulatory protein OraA/RecX
MLDESKIDGGEIMPTLAQQMKEEFREEFKEQFMETMGPQLKDEGKKEEKKEIAKQMLRKGFDLDTIIDITGLEKTEIEKLSSEI